MLKKNIPCPRCRESGGDPDGNHMFLMDKRPGWYMCRKCHYSISADGVEDSNFGNRMNNQDQSKDRASISALNLLPHAALPDRKIRQDIAELFGVRVTASEVYGLAEPERHHYPYFDRKNRLIAYKNRIISSKHFFWTGNRKGAKLFGQNVCEGKKRLIIVEGEVDCLSAYQMLSDYLQQRYPGRSYKPCVVSIPDGASTSGISDNIDFIDNFDEVVLCLDQDDVGKEAAQKIAFELSRPNIKVAKISEKDASDMLVEGKASEFITAVFNADPWSPSGFGPITIDEVNRSYGDGCKLPYPLLQDKLHGLREGEVTVVTAGSGAGKSTFVREIGISLMSQGFKTANIFLEETKADTAKCYIAMLEGRSPGFFKVKPDLVDDTAKHKWMDFLNERGTFHDSFGSMEVDQLMRKLRYCVKVERCKFIILDHISIIVSGQDTGSNERKEIDLAMTKIVSFAVENRVGILIVSHLSKNKDKSWATGAVPSIEDLRGSMALSQLSFNVIALSRNTSGENDDNPNMASLWVLKNRAFGFTGKADVVVYNHNTGRLVSTDDPQTQRVHGY